MSGDVLDGMVDASRIGVSERIGVFTRMGNQIACGVVLSTSPQGLVVKEDSGTRFFRNDLHRFVPLDSEYEQYEPNLPINGPVFGTDPDFMVDRKLGEQGKSDANGKSFPKPDAGKAPKIEKKNGSGFGKKDDPKLAKNGEDKKKDDAKKKPAPFQKKPLSKPKPIKQVDKGDLPDGSSVNVSELPPDIQQRVISTKELNDEQLNRIISDIGDTSLASLKRAKVSEMEIYGLVDTIQKSIVGVLKKYKGGGDADDK